MKELIARLEAAPEGSRELDAEIALAIGEVKVWRSKHGYWNVEGPVAYRGTVAGLSDYDPDTGKKNDVDAVPSGWWSVTDIAEYTASLDDAMTLVPEGCGYKIHGDNVEHSMEFEAQVDYGEFYSGATPALALCIAALKARV